MVNYAEVESMWAGETAKNVAAVFRAASDEGAVLFFDEADAIAARRSAAGGAQQAYHREANAVVNVLLHELEAFNGVVVFATNLAANFDPAFGRRIRTHVLFEMPGPAERARIWRVQVHPALTPLADDVDFDALAERYPASGGDIKNAVLKAAAAAASEAGPDLGKRIHQRHFERAMDDVLAGKAVMRQSLLTDDAPPATPTPPGTVAVTPEQAPLVEAMQGALAQAEARWKATATLAVAMGGLALLAAVGALGAALAR
jgi:SpoVK/Ycf46/Vps4 family AAA+-type ATPase